MSPVALWLDVDPGHDDAIAILLALHCPEIELLGVSTVHGNAPAIDTYQNACRLLYAFGGADIPAHPGASKPLLRITQVAPEIHGVDGLGGVEGLPSNSDPLIQAQIERGSKTRAIEAIASAIIQKAAEGRKVTIATCGPLTNMALFISVYPDLVKHVECLVFMGGGIGIGNRAPVAEYNIFCDPEAAQIVLNAPLEKIMIPINITHTAIFEHFYHSMLLDPSKPPHFSGVQLPPPITPLRHTISTLLTFFADTYRSTFGFLQGPPLHDALTVACIARRELFDLKRYRVDVELSGTHSLGQTVVDIWDHGKCDDSWGPTGKNCVVVQSVVVEEFFALLFECVNRCDKVSPLNNNASH